MQMDNTFWAYSIWFPESELSEFLASTYRPLSQLEDADGK